MLVDKRNGLQNKDEDSFQSPTTSSLVIDVTEIYKLNLTEGGCDKILLDGE